jgi:hypothetical protein
MTGFLGRVGEDRQQQGQQQQQQQQLQQQQLQRQKQQQKQRRNEVLPLRLAQGQNDKDFCWVKHDESFCGVGR